jgi:predicted AlkP superfamily phosphohydrolase/phosphomutase
MSARVLVIGLDAADPEFIARMTAAGEMPTIARLAREGATAGLTTPLRTLPGAIWPELETGISCGKIPHYYHPRQIHTGEAAARPIAAGEVNAENYFWVRAARAGKSVAAIDLPQSVLAKDFPGIQMLEWGLHDRNFAIAASPATFLDDVRARFGDHPVGSCDKHGCSVTGYKTLLQNLEAGIRKKTELLETLLESRDWDLFVGCFGETHCVGHQFWHFQDPNHSRYDPRAPEDLKNAMRTIYALADAGIARLLEVAGKDATVIVLASHGMDAYTGGPKLLPEVLSRLQLTSEKSGAVGRSFRALQRAKHPAALAAKAVVKKIVGPMLLRRTQEAAGALHAPLESPLTRAADVDNNRCGAIRLNLKGREPFGAVAPGNEATAIIEDIRTALLELERPGTGERIVESVSTARELFGPNHHPDVPDLIVVFRDDIGPIESAQSARLGRIDVPLFSYLLPRSGDHKPRSQIWMKGSGIAPGATGEGNVLDLAPTVLQCLGLSLPPDIDGKPLRIARAAQAA